MSIYTSVSEQARDTCWRKGFQKTAIAGGFLLLPSCQPASAATSAVDSSNLQLRFATHLLKQPPVSMGSNLNNGIDNFYFPDYLQGTFGK